MSYLATLVECVLDGSEAERETALLLIQARGPSFPGEGGDLRACGGRTGYVLLGITLLSALPHQHSVAQSTSDATPFKHIGEGQ